MSGVEHTFPLAKTRVVRLEGRVDPGSALRRLLFIGSLDVAPTFGGPIQFHRHFVERHDFAFAKLIEPLPQQRLPSLRTNVALLDRMIDRVSRTRLFPHFAALNEWVAVERTVPGLLREAVALRPQAIVTVAFGAYGFAAAYVAERLNVPLITFFHDWWPDLALQSRLGIRAFDWRMKWLYRRTNLALCVCEEMREELGSNPNAKVLYPISGTHNGHSSQRKCRPRPRVVYLGGMTRGYGRMLAALSRAYSNRSGVRAWELAIFGDARDWPMHEAAEASNLGVYRGSRYGEAARNELAEADVFLVAMDFELSTKRRVRTSFPSKLLDYCAYGRPVIAWAPEYSSVAGFARRRQFPFLHCSPDPEAMVDKIDELVHAPARLSENAATARELGAAEFSPDRIHAELVSLIRQTMDRCDSVGASRSFRALAAGKTV